MINNPQFREPIEYPLSPGWANWFTQAFEALFAIYQSGTTAQRPTLKLWVGRPYFDTTLGYIIHYDGTNWVDGAGSTV